MSKKQTQKSEVLRHLQENNTITQAQATDLFGAYRLSAIIYDLRHKDGYDIETIGTKHKSRYGVVGSHATYRLVS